MSLVLHLCVTDICQCQRCDLIVVFFIENILFQKHLYNSER